MLIFLRKLTNNDTKKQIETTAEAYSKFFMGDPKESHGVVVPIKSGGVVREFVVSKAAGNANSYRFASNSGQESFSNFIRSSTQKDFDADDILKITLLNNEYALELIKKDDPKYSFYDELNVVRQNTVIHIDTPVRDDSRVTGGVNELFYGVPGAGKSFEIKRRVGAAHYERVVFHPDYTYSDFVGQIMPRVRATEQGEEKLTYEFVDGPFTKAIKYADDHPSERTYLVIEEINRGNAPAIFGDIFQLLDRDDTGKSEFGITNYELAKSLKYEDLEHRVFIPSNLSILATMNTSDQNVFTLDTAFQRRWKMHHIKNEVEKSEHAKSKIMGSKVTWSDFVCTINGVIVEYSREMASSEDKQLGAYFVKMNELTAEAFPEKALKYLWDDAFKLDRDRVFGEDIKSIDDLINTYNEAITTKEDPIKRVMNADVYNRMMDMSASSNAEAIDESEKFEAEIPNEVNK